MLRAKTKFNKKTAKGFAKVDYYRACVQNYKKFKFIQEEKRRLATTKKTPIRELIKKWKTTAQTGD
jgi:hypothetical protein